MPIRKYIHIIQDISKGLVLSDEITNFFKLIPNNIQTYCDVPIYECMMMIKNNRYYRSITKIIMIELVDHLMR